MSHFILVHYGELALKGGNRGAFEQKLSRNIEEALGGKSLCSVRRLSGRFLVEFHHDDHEQRAIQSLSRVFGICNFAPCMKVASSVEAIEHAALLLAGSCKGKSFAVRTRRGEKQFPYSSQDMNIRIGSLLQHHSGAKVDLEHPEYELVIEILNESTFLYDRCFSGPGGLPLGTSGQVACLISGGIDSPVAAYRMMKRGCTALYLHFSSAPFTSEASREKVIDMIEHLKGKHQFVKLFIVPFGDIQQKIVAGVPPKYRVLLYRRMMFRIAEQLARKEHAEALVTGESLSQVASQTLSNMAAIEHVVSMPILRPLVGMDKQEIVDEAKKIGTYATSCEPHDDCCSFLMPPHPATKSCAAELDAIESSLSVDALVALGMQQVELKVLS